MVLEIVAARVTFRLSFSTALQLRPCRGDPSWAGVPFGGRSSIGLGESAGKLEGCMSDIKSSL